MPPAEDIQRYLTGSWRLMMGKPDGVHLLDLSADGFWNSFFAILVALPALIAGWVTIANELGQDPHIFGNRFSILVRLAVVDIAAWVLPLVALAFTVRTAGIADRFVHYVVASNWGSALLYWLMLPPVLIKLFAPEARELATIVYLVFFGVSMVLTWRLTNTVLGKGPAVAAGLFIAMFAATLAVIFTLQSMLGLTGVDQLTG